MNLLDQQIQWQAQSLLRSLEPPAALSSNTMWWKHLAAHEEKLSLFFLEPFIRETWHDCRVLWGDATLPYLNTVAPILFRPDAIAGRRIERTVDFLEQHSLVPIAWTRVQLSGVAVRELWRYQWNASTLDGVELFSDINTASPALLVIFKDRQHGDIPSTMRIQRLKGSAIVDERNSMSIRSVLRSPNAHFVFMHAPDEPADILRELAILLNKRERRRLLHEIEQGMQQHVDDTKRHLFEEVHQLYSTTEECDFDIDAARERVIAALLRVRSACTDPRAVEDLLGLLRSTESRGRIGWLRIEALLDRIGLQVSQWDKLLVGSWATESVLTGYRGIITREMVLSWYP